jgi:hypothetical protein
VRTVDDLRNVLAGFPTASPDPVELERLRAFFERMKLAGIATTRPYDLPPLDTIGRGFVASHSSKQSSR